MYSYSNTSLQLVRVIKLSGSEQSRTYKPFTQSMSSSSKTLVHAINPETVATAHPTKDTSTNMEVLFTILQHGCRHNDSVTR